MGIGDPLNLQPDFTSFSRYVQSAFFMSQKVFYDYGLIPGHNVIYTFETKNNPFTYADAEAELKTIKF